MEEWPVEGREMTRGGLPRLWARHRRRERWMPENGAKETGWRDGEDSGGGR